MGESDQEQGPSETSDRLRRCQDLLRRLTLDFGHLAYTRQMFSAVQDTIGAAPRLLSPLFPFELWLVTNYMIACITGIRRQTNTNNDAVSLLKFLSVLVEDPSAVTRSGFKALYPPDDKAKAEQRFDELVGCGGAVLTKKVVGLDRTALTRAAEPIRQFATERIAHHLEDADGLDAELNQINDCADLAIHIFRKYLVLLFGPLAPTTESAPPQTIFGRN